jgi:uncharacterized protein
MKLRKLLATCGAVVLIAVVSTATACSPSPAVMYQGTPGQPGVVAGTGGIIVSQQSVGMWVNGLGKTTGVPDVVLLTLGVQSQNKTVAQAQKAAVDAMNGIMLVLKNAGIADKDIQTTQYNIQQLTRWDDKTSTSVITGYQISNIVTVKIRDISKAGSVIDKAADAGGDLIRVNGISFMVDDPAPLLKIARDKAVRDAIDKAKQMSQASGVRLGRLLYISESTPYVPVVQTNYLKMAAPEMAAAPTSISGGELEFQVNVQLVYEMN